LIKRGRDADAAKALSRLTSLKVDDPDVEIELNDIRANLEEEQKLGQSSYADCFKNGHNKIAFRTLTGIFIQACVAGCISDSPNTEYLPDGNSSLVSTLSSTMVLRSSSNSGIKNAFLITVATNVVNVFMTLPGMWGVERFGRRRLLLVGAAGMCICEFIIAIVGVTISVDNIAGQKVLVAFVCIYIVRFMLLFLWSML
jgi:SP family sugar:H+ symporter-like MFS transporter